MRATYPWPESLWSYPPSVQIINTDNNRYTYRDLDDWHSDTDTYKQQGHSYFSQQDNIATTTFSAAGGSAETGATTGYDVANSATIAATNQGYMDYHALYDDIGTINGYKGKCLTITNVSATSYVFLDDSATDYQITEVVIDGSDADLADVDSFKKINGHFYYRTEDDVDGNTNPTQTLFELQQYVGSNWVTAW